MLLAARGWIAFIVDDFAHAAAIAELEHDVAGRAVAPPASRARRATSAASAAGILGWESNQEDFLVLSGEGLLLVEGEGAAVAAVGFRALPGGTNHIILGAGEGQCVVLAVGAREQQGDADWGGYTVDEVALRHGARVEQETSDAEQAYARFPGPVPTRYRDGWLLL